MEDAPRVHEWLLGAIAAHRLDDLDLAQRGYARVLREEPDNPDALHYLGVLSHQRGDSGAAVSLIGRALASMPLYADAHNNLGNVHKECGRLAEAEASYRRALDCAPGHPDALGNLAVVLEARGELVGAFKVHGLLLKLMPEHAPAYYRLAMFLRANAENRGHIEQSMECLRAASRLDPGNTRMLEQLGVTLYMLGRHEEAVSAYRAWTERAPDDPVPRHMLAASGGAPPPPRAADDYVRQTFDDFAPRFDEQLLANLGYRAPQMVADALAAAMPGYTGMEILDAGCGTGLCAPLLRPRARRLVGVDLSEGMIARARARGGYDEIVAGELTAYLRACAAAFDAVVSADTLVYFGDLHEVAAAARGALRPGGAFVFTVEALDGGHDVELGPSGRYRHGDAHVRRALEAAGFVRIDIAGGELRREFGRQVRGWVVAARAPDGPLAE